MLGYPAGNKMPMKVAAMEDVLDIYQSPYDAKVPVVCTIVGYARLL